MHCLGDFGSVENSVNGVVIRKLLDVRDTMCHAVVGDLTTTCRFIMMHGIATPKNRSRPIFLRSSTTKRNSLTSDDHPRTIIGYSYREIPSAMRHLPQIEIPHPIYICMELR